MLKQATYLIFTLAILANITLTSLFAEEWPTDMKFEHLTVEDGLSSNSVISVLQDSQGFMWFGTMNGLNKYDGMEFTVYVHHQEQPDSLSNNFIWGGLIEDQTGTLWVGTWCGGLNQFDSVNDKFIHYQHDENNPKSLGSDCVWSIYEDSKRNLWITGDKGLSRFNRVNKTFTRYQHDPNDPNSLSHNAIVQMHEDKDGMLWVATYGGGVNKFDPESQNFVHYRHDDNNPKSLINDFVLSSYQDSVGRLWFGTENGLERFDPVTETFTHYQHDENDPNSLSHNAIISIYQDSRGILWISTRGGGLNQFDPINHRFSRYQNDNRYLNSLSDNTVWYMTEDVTGTLWIGTDTGVSKYDPKGERFVHYQHNPKNANSLSDNQVNAIYEDDSGVLWLGTKGRGLNRFDRTNNSFTHYQHEENNPNSLSHNTIMAILPDGKGKLWIGTVGGGMNLFDPKKKVFTRYRHNPNNPNSLPKNQVRDMKLDLNGLLWIAVAGTGFSKFDPVTETFVHYFPDESDPNSLVSEWVYVIYVDTSNTVWIGTDSGISRFDPKSETFINYLSSQDDPNSLSNESIHSIYEDSRGIIWIGTNDGLNRFDKLTNTFTVYRDKQGLVGNSVASIVEDDNGFLWISTDKGLSKFNVQSETFRNYDRRDGLQSNTFLWHSDYKSQTGELFFGGVNGFNAFYPDKLADNPHIPSVVLTDFQLFNHPVPIGGESPLQQHISVADQIMLSYHQSVFSFKFAALNYRTSTKNQYAYMMEGFDQDWTYTNSQRRFATYTNLDAGEYTFRVKASNNDGLWNEQGTSIKVIILPPWWQTWWAYTLYAMVILGSIIGIFLAQQRKLAQTRAFNKRLTELNDRLQQADQLKDEFLGNTSHELRTPLNGIIGLAESLIDGVAGELSDKAKTNLAMIVGSGKRLSVLVNDILDFSKLKHKDIGLQLKPIGLRELVDVVLTLSGPLVAQKPVQLLNNIDINLSPVMADENRLQQILHNLVGNAIKFTDNGQVEVSAQRLEQHLQITVSDTGIGIDEEKLDRIFESFEQAEGGTAREYGGTGLGLAVTKQLVQLHGGEIWVESTPKLGSQFRFTLPISSEPVSESLSVSRPPLSKVQAASEDIIY
jgi:two-component system sensor histidine kinase ChiS